MRLSDVLSDPSIDTGADIPFVSKKEEISLTKIYKDSDKKEFYWTEEELEDVLISLVKPEGKYTKQYNMKYFNITFRTLLDEEQAQLNDYLQRIDSKGDIRWEKVVRNGVTIESQTFIHRDSDRLIRITNLAFYIENYCGEDLSSKTFEDKVAFLEKLNGDLLDFIFFNCLVHFKSLVAEALNKSVFL